MKYCNNCKTWKEEIEFPKRSKSKDGLSSKCKACHKTYNDAHKEQHKQYYRAHREQKLKYAKEYREQNLNEINKKKREHYYDNRERITAERREKYLIYKNNSIYKLNRIMSKSIWDALKGLKADRHWENIVEYTLEELKEHLESQFNENMTWDNMGNYWEIDHIVPKNQFQYKTEQDIEFKICWSLLNLRPLEKIANKSRPKDGRDIPDNTKQQILNQFKEKRN